MARISTTLLALALLLAACGDDEPEPTPGDEPAAEQPAAAEPGPAAGQQADTAAAVSADTPDAAPEAAAEPEPPSRDGRRYTAQVAAFLSADSADKWTGILARQGMPVYSYLHEVRGRPFHRVRVGVTESLEQARAVGRLMTRRYRWPVWIAPVSPAEPIPENAIERTRTLIDGG